MEFGWIGKERRVGGDFYGEARQSQGPRGQALIILSAGSVRWVPSDDTPPGTESWLTDGLQVCQVVARC